MILNIENVVVEDFIAHLGETARNTPEKLPAFLEENINIIRAPDGSAVIFRTEEELDVFNNNTALHWVAEKGSVGLIRHLIELGVDIGSRDGQDRNLLMSAVQQPDMFMFLLSLSNRGLLEKDRSNRTVFDYAEQFGHVSVKTAMKESGLFHQRALAGFPHMGKPTI